MMKKVIWISSYLPRSCGIAFYSQDYINAIKNYAKKHNQKISIKIISHIDAAKANYPVIDQTDRDWDEKVFKIIKKETPSIVHIQHEYGLYETYEDQNRHLLKLLEKLKQEKIPTVMTYHSIYEKLEPPHKFFVKESLQLLSAGIFHEDYQKQALKKNIGFIPKNLYVLPHGSDNEFNPDKKKLRREYGYTDKLVVGAAGIADQRKGFRTMIRQWPKIVKRFPNAFLVLEIKPHADKLTRIYINEVMKAIMKSKVNNNIELIVKDYKKLEFLKRLASFDILALPYKSESQSGVLANGFAAHTPAIVTDIEGLGAEIRNSKAGLLVKMKHRRNDFYKTILKLLASKTLRNKYSKNAALYVKNVSGWNIIAKKTFKIYEGVQ
ncbi:MAG: glycosyltransferase [Nanoarchaeota archaeon]|nr:glycosyltransferase [Nanoarchaeota archaeon]MBU1027605.1 glycosyltransferase [Nanoarchaeota archaeon]